jgi:type II secretion system protein J
VKQRANNSCLRGLVLGLPLGLTRGFTLLELVISMTIFSLIIVGVYAGLNIGAESAARGIARSIENQRARAALSLMTRQLKSAYPLTLQAEGETFVYFFGGPSELSFISGAGQAEAGGLTKITYFLRDEDGRSSLWVRTTAPALPADLVEDREGGLVQESQILPEVEELSWGYFGKVQTQTEWTDEWDGRENRQLPKAIRCAWRARLGELPLEWEFEVPIQVQVPHAALQATPDNDSNERERRRDRRRGEE